MTTDVRFTYPKDPDETKWHGITFWSRLVSIEGVTATESQPPLVVDAHYSVPGDTVNRGDVAVEDYLLAPDFRTVLVLLSGGTPRKSYAIQVKVTDGQGNHPIRSVILPISGR